jgi:hypothetical protein
MPQPIGRRVPLSLPRRFIGDLVYFAQKMPLCTALRTMRLAELADARAGAFPCPGWCALFVRAYGLVAAARPELRWSYVPLPWPHFYEHPHSIASVAVERDYGAEKAVFFGHIRAPETQSLAAIGGHLRDYKEAPIDDIALFRRILYTSRLPRPLRRLMWRFGLYTSGHRRSRYFGTFGVSVTSALGATTVDLLTPISTALNYGILTADGSLDVRLTYDHRVLDGGTAARALAELEETLNTTMLAEVRDLVRGPRDRVTGSASVCPSPARQAGVVTSPTGRRRPK